MEMTQTIINRTKAMDFIDQNKIKTFIHKYSPVTGDYIQNDSTFLNIKSEYAILHYTDRKNALLISKPNDEFGHNVSLTKYGMLFIHL